MTAPVPPDCRNALDRLQVLLDGDPAPLSAFVRAHLQACATCRDRFRAADGLRNAVLPAATVAPLLTERWVLAVRRDAARRRHVRRFAWAGTGAMAVAASAAIWLVARPPLPTEVVRVETNPPSNVVLEHPPNFALGGLGSALISLSKRTATDVADQGRLLLPDVAIPATIPPTDGAARPLDEARTGLAEGFEPVTTSARRAFGLLNGFANANVEPKD